MRWVTCTISATPGPPTPDDLRKPGNVVEEGDSRLSIYALKPRFQNLLRPVTVALARAGVTANQVTVAAAVVSVALAGFVVCGASGSVGIRPDSPVVVARMACNAIDGMLAGSSGSKPGWALLNELADVVSDTALCLPFALLPPFSPLWTGVVIVLAIVGDMRGRWGRWSGRRAVMKVRWERATVPSLSARSGLGRAGRAAAGLGGARDAGHRGRTGSHDRQPRARRAGEGE